MPVPERSEERRRTPRVPVVGSRLEIPTRNNVRVVDIGGRGVLLSSPCRIEPGRLGRLHVKLGDDQVQLELEICRASPEEASGPGPFYLGAKLLPIGPSGAAAVKRFLGETQR